MKNIKFRKVRNVFKRSSRKIRKVRSSIYIQNNIYITTTYNKETESILNTPYTILAYIIKSNYTTRLIM